MSERLGIPIENVSVVHGDTDKVQFGMGTYGSRSGAVGMSAIVKALDKVEAKAKKVAAHMLEAAEGDIEFKDGKFTVAGTDKSAAWGDVALNAYIAHKFAGQELEPGLKEGAFYDPTNFTFPAGCHICEVEIDPETGKTEIVAWTAVDDFGIVINPMIVEGQVHGGIAQGVGQALLEDAVYDQERAARHRLVHGLHHAARGRLPAAPCRDDDDHCPSNPLGIKGCGRPARSRRRRGDQRHDRCHRYRGIRDAGHPAVVWAALRRAPARHRLGERVLLLLPGEHRGRHHGVAVDGIAHESERRRRLGVDHHAPVVVENRAAEGAEVFPNTVTSS